MNEAFIQLLQATLTVNSVSNLGSEEDELAFGKLFRELIQTLSIFFLTFTEFTFEDISINEQIFEDHKSKYLE